MEVPPDLERDWGFMHPWCVLIRSRVRCGVLSCDVLGDDEAFQPTATQYLHINTTAYSSFQSVTQGILDLQNIREALALLATIAHVDFSAWQYLTGYKTIKDKLPCYVLHVRDKVKQDIIQFCGTHQLTSPSQGFLNAMAIIATLDTREHLQKEDVDIQVPIRVSSDSLFGAPDTLKEIYAAEMVVAKEWRRFNQSLGNQPVQPGSLRCTFVMEPMVAKTYSISEGTMTALSRLMQHNVWFSHLSVRIESTRESTPKATKELMQLVTALFDTVRRYPELANTRYNPGPEMHVPTRRRLQLDSLHLQCYGVRPLDVEALFSAMAINQTTRKLSISTTCDRGRYGSDSSLFWKWLAYGVFSKRARECSALESLTLDSINSMSTNDMQSFATIAASEHPEESLHRCPRGIRDDADATLRSGAQVYRHTFANGMYPRQEAAPLRFPAALHPVRIFSDDGNSKWVNVLIAGLGRCLVQRSDLEFNEVGSVHNGSSRLTALTVFLPEHLNVAKLDGLPHFLKSVGASLKCLTLDARTIKMDENAVLRCCPNLQELWRHRSIFQVQFKFSEYLVRNQRQPELRIVWNDISALTRSLSDSEDPVYKCVQSLRIRLTNLEDTYSSYTEFSSIMDTHLDEFLQMLEVNQRLEYLEIIAPAECSRYEKHFQAYHQQALGNGLKSLLAKIAFLSVVAAKSMSTRSRANKRRKNELADAHSALGDFDEHVMTRIFEFGASPVFREVHFNSISFEDENTPPSQC